MRALGISALLFILLVSTARAQKTYDDRVDSVKIFFENLVANRNYCSAHAMIAHDASREAGLGMLDTLLLEIGYTAINRFRMTALYLHEKDVLPEPFVEDIRSIWRVEPILPPHEEYEKLVYYTALKLSAEHLPAMDTWFNGKSTQENDANATAYIKHWMDETTHKGQQIYDSPTYASAMIVSMLLLQQFSADSVLANKARVMASWLLSDFALDYLEGQYAGSHGKESNESAMFPIVSDMSQFGWLYFGDGYQLYGLEQYFAAIADFKLEPEIVELATDRKSSYESYETKRSGTRIRGAEAPTYNIPKYTYMTPLYAVGSVPGGLNSVGEQHSWDVTWVSRTRNTTVFSLHPFADPLAVSEFIPHPPENAYKFYTVSNTYYATASKSVGGSPYESILQHKNTVIALYDIPENLPRFPFLTAYLPLQPQALDIDSNGTGWVTMDVGDVYIALYPMKAYNIFPESNSQRLYSRGGRNGVVVQVAGKNEIGAYSTFRSKVRKSKVNLKKFESDGIVSYTSIFGEKLEAQCGARGKINGAPPTFPDGMLFSSPKVSSHIGSGTMTIQGRKTTLTLDINSGTLQRKNR